MTTFGEAMRAIPPEQLAEAIEAWFRYKDAEKDFKAYHARFRRLEAAIDAAHLPGLMFAIRRDPRFRGR